MGAGVGTMIEDTVSRLVGWLLEQDPIVWLVVFLLIRAEVRTEQALRALKLLRHLHIDADTDANDSLRNE